jgi:hypothetical protein
MEFSNNKSLYGVPNGCFIGQQDRVDELNMRIHARQFSDTPLPPNYDPRPTSTKYSLFPVIERRKPIKETKYTFPEHSVEINFNPATQNGPPSTYFRSIDTETILRNQTVALQHGADQGVYVPSSNSDLYRTNMDFLSANRNSIPSVHSSLFEKPIFTSSIPPSISQRPIGKDVFYNHTRTQLRNTISSS